MAVEKGEKSPKIVSVEPKPKKGILSAAVNLLEEIVVSLAGLSGKPNYYLSGNFAPVLEETPPSGELKIRGTLPVREFWSTEAGRFFFYLVYILVQECLNGEFVRVGPNPKLPPVAGYHW